MINISKEFKNRLYKTDIYRVLCNIRGTRRTDLPSDFMKNKPQPQSLDNMSPKTLRSDAGLLLIWLNSSHRVPDCIIVIQIAPFAWFLFFFSITTLNRAAAEGFLGILWKILLVSGSHAAPASVHRHRASLIQSFLRWFHQDGQAAVGHLSLLHGAHQLHGKRQRAYWQCVR